MIVLSDYLFIFALSKSWKSVRNSLKNDWKMYKIGCFLPWKNVI